MDQAFNSSESELAVALFTPPNVNHEPESIRRMLGAYDTLLDRYMPPSILVDEKWMVLDTFGGTGRFLTLKHRRPTQSIFELVCEPLRDAIYRAIEQLCGGEHPVTISPVYLDVTEGTDLPHRLVVSSVPSSQDSTVFYSLAIERICEDGDDDTPWQSAYYAAPNPLNCIVRETGRYDDRRGSVGEASASSSLDLKKFLDATNLAVVVLDQGLHILDFSSRAAAMFHLVQHDIGRQIRTFAGVLEVPDLVERIDAVVHTGDSDEVEVHLHRIGKYYVVRISPFSIDTNHGGAVLHVIDLSCMETRKQEARLLSSIVQSSADAIVSRDRNNRIVTWNAAAEELYGYSASEAIGQDASLIATDSRGCEEDLASRLLQKGGFSQHFESLRRTKSGETIEVSTRLSPVYDDDHRVIGVSSIERDNSKQRELVERLSVGAQKYQDFFNQSPDMYCSVDVSSGKIVECNDRMCARLGLNQNEILGHPILDFYTPETREEARLGLDRLRSAGEVADQELVLSCRDGIGIPITLSVSALRDASGTIIRSRNVLRDVTISKQKEEQFRQSERQYRNSFHNSAIGIAMYDLCGNYMMVNRRMAEIVGYAEHELIGKQCYDLTNSEDLVDERQLQTELVAGRSETYKLEKRYLHKAGHSVWVSEFVSLERDEKGCPLYCHAYIEDISARKELEAELRLAISQRDEFLAMLSHELRNPLGAIINTCAVLNRGKEIPKSLQQPVAIVTRQARQMTELLDDLLDVSRITSGKIKLEKSTVLLSEIVDEAVESQQALALNRHQRLSVTYADEPLYVFGDRSRLVQIVVNLLNNAIKYSGDGSEIAVALEKRSGHEKGQHCESEAGVGVITVTDSGVGIEPELIESLFEMFAQRDSTLDRSGGGMGLGLHLVRKLVEFHSGSVIGRSEGVGKGSEFMVELPLSPQRQSARHRKDKAKPVLPTRPPAKRIAVVEDIADARNMLVALLEADDYQVSSAADGVAGLALILRERPDLAIVDIGLPELDGYEVARQVREKISKAELRLVALSGYGQDSDHDRAIAAGFDLHLVKPLNHARLEKILSGF